MNNQYNKIKILNKIMNILGDNFELNNSLICENEIHNDKLFYFEFINKSMILNKNKLEYITEKINLLKKNNIIEIEDLKISNKGRFIRIEIKTEEDYQNEKLKLQNEYLENIKNINERIEKINKLLN